MKIGAVARASGLSVHTLRYYERIGLSPGPARTIAGLRDYDGGILVWLEFLGRLKTTGMPIRDMLRYAQLRAAGPATEPERCRLLQAHRGRVRAHLADLHACLDVLDTKIAAYGDPGTEDTDDARRPTEPAL